LTLHFNPFSDFLSIVGMKAAGKTTLTKFYLKSLTSLIFIDPTWQLDGFGYVIHYPDRLDAAFREWKKIVYQPIPMTTEAYTQVFDSCLGLYNYTLGIDEIDKFAKPRWYICDSLKELINRGRRQGIGLICNTRRPHLIHNDIRSSSDHVVCFKLHEERDRKYMAEWLEVDELTIKHLPFYESLYYNVRKAEVTKQTALPQSIVDSL